MKFLPNILSVNRGKVSHKEKTPANLHLRTCAITQALELRWVSILVRNGISFSKVAKTEVFVLAKLSLLIHSHQIKYPPIKYNYV